MDYILSVAVTFGLSALFTAFFIPQIIFVAFKKQLFDVVDERKVHHGIVPRLGGVAFVPAVIISLALMAANCESFFSWSFIHFDFDLSTCLVLGAFTLLYIEGIADDVVGIGYKIKFVVQFLCAALIVGSGVYISDFAGLFGLNSVPLFFAYAFSILLIVFVINAINLIDGIDGLSSGISMIATFVFGCFFMLKHDYMYALLSFASLGTLASFFIYNVFGKAEHKNKIFMGDCGSQCIGLLLAVLGIRQMASEEMVVGIDALPHALVIFFTVLMIPGLDVLRVMGGRMLRHRNPFLPDKTHIHHLFLDLGLSHRMAMCCILMMDIFFVVLNMLIVDVMNINLVLTIDIVLWGLIIYGISTFAKINKDI